ncbi:TlpA family protein disulfide reductase [Bradyrhizobium sp. DN5]|uniref:TlpA family protein disulfide reductase n=1 Tax=Bradyrhizobium sp. DN5 TaxID=3056950 RepID=UPI0035253426
MIDEELPKSELRHRIRLRRRNEQVWMELSSSVGIPTSCVIDRDGKIGFICHPTQLDDVLPKVLDCSWSNSEEAIALDVERINSSRRRKRDVSQKQALIEPIFARLGPAMKRMDWLTAFSAVEEALASMPDEVIFRGIQAELLLHKMRDMAAGLPVLHQLVRDAIDKKSVVWMSVAIRKLFDPAKLPRAERFAMGKELCEHILAAKPSQGSEGAKFLSYGAIAQYYYETGRRGRAIELVTLGLKWLDAAPAMDDATGPHAMLSPGVGAPTGVRTSVPKRAVRRHKTCLPKSRDRNR